MIGLHQDGSQPICTQWDPPITEIHSLINFQNSDSEAAITHLRVGTIAYSTSPQLMCYFDDSDIFQLDWKESGVWVHTYDY